MNVRQVSGLSPKRALFEGAAWFFAMRYSVKVMGLVSTLVMARLITPEDYSLVAMAMLVVGLANAMMEFGVGSVILTQETITDDEVNSAWTLRLWQHLAVGVIVVVSAAPAALYFKDARVEVVLYWLGVSVAVSGAGNMAGLLAARALDFSLEFKVGVICKLLGVLTTVAGGYLLGDYRALTLGVMTGHISGALMTYALHKHRPRWNTQHIGKLWATSKWLMFGSTAGFLMRKADEFAAARIGSAAEYGQYTVGADVGQMPAGELGGAMIRALLPVLSSMQADKPRTNSAVIKTLLTVNTIIFPASAIFCALAVPATLILLGPQWREAAQFVTVFAFVSVAPLVNSPLNTLLLLRGYAKVNANLAWVEFGVFTSLSLALVPVYGLIGLGIARLAGSLITVVMSGSYAIRSCGLEPCELLAAIVRPLLGAGLAGLMTWAVTAPLEGHWLQVLVGSAAGGALFVTWSFASWHLMGRPEGVESTLVDLWRRR